MARFFTMVCGLFFVVALFPLLLTGLGELIMGIPFVGACIATLAGVLLSARGK